MTASKNERLRAYVVNATRRHGWAETNIERRQTHELIPAVYVLSARAGPTLLHTRGTAVGNQCLHAHAIFLRQFRNEGVIVEIERAAPR